MNRKTMKMVLYAYEHDRHDYKTQLYAFVKPRANGEFTLTVYAVNETKRYGIRVTEVNRAWSDRNYFKCKNIWRNVWGTTMIEFDERKKRPFESYDWYNGKWGGNQEWGTDDAWFVKYIRYANLDALADTKYRYCAYDKYRGDIGLVNYCQLLNQFPQVEILAKNGLSKFVNVRFLTKAKKDKGFANFFRSQIEEIKNGYGVDDVIRAYRNGWTLEKARCERRIQYAYNDCPKGIDKHELDRYLTKNLYEYWDWKNYIDTIQRLDEDIHAFGVTFPRNLHQASISAQKRKNRRDAKLEAERQANIRKMAKKVNAMLKKMHDRLAFRLGNLEIIVPKSREEFVAEGNAMHNCIGGYYDNCADGNTVCFFMHKNGEPYCDVEMSKGGKIRQCYLKCNAKPNESTRTIAEIMAKNISKELRKVA